MRCHWDEEKNRINRRKHEDQLRTRDEAMKKTKKRIAEMRREYDFSNGERGKFFHVSESQRMIPLDADIVRYFQRRARSEKKAYYALINETLRRTMNYEKPAASIAEVLQGIIAEEVQKHAARK